MKKILSLIIVISVFVGFFVWLYGLATKDIFQEEEGISPLPQEYVERENAPKGGLMVLSNEGFIQIEDITEDPVMVYEGQVFVSVDNDTFSILYYAMNDQFLITLKQKDDFMFARAYAEETFLKKLNITQVQACGLAVDLVIPPYIDFDLAGSYGLSFCPGALAVP